MVRRTVTVLAVIGCLILCGCSHLPLPLLPHAAAAEPVAVGTCLAELNGVDSDRTSVVSCDSPHYFDVVGIITWPGMADATRDHGAARVFNDIVGGAKLEESADYFEWVFDACAQEVGRATGLDVLGYRDPADRLLPGGTYFIDASLASRDAFVGGDLSTVCSIAWIDDRGENTKISFAPKADVTDFFGDGLPSETRSCFDEVGDYASCDAAHYSQRIANFDLLGVFGEEFTAAELTDEQSEAVLDYCEDLVWDLSPSADEYIWAYPLYLPEDVPEVADATVWYTWACDIAAPEGELLEGDVYTGGGSSGSSGSSESSGIAA